MRKRVIDIIAATATLGKNQSGSLIVLNRAAGIVVTLPSPGRGLEYEFIVKTAVTSNVYSITKSGTSFIRGEIIVASSGDPGKMFVGNGSTHITISMSGSTTGGLVGTHIKLVCDNDGIWEATGFASGSGTVATPFST